MELNSNFRKRRLLEDTVSSSNSPLLKRDVGTTTINTSPMTLDTYTQTDAERSDSPKGNKNLEMQIEQIFQVLSKHDSILNEIRNAILDNNNRNSNVLHNSINSTISSENANYKIVASGGDAISIEPVKPEDIIEEQLSPDTVTYVTNHYEVPKMQNASIVPSSNSNIPMPQSTVYRYENEHNIRNLAREFKQPSPDPPKIEYPFVNKNVLVTSNYMVKPPIKDIKTERFFPESSTSENRPLIPQHFIQPNGNVAQGQANELVALGANGTCILKSVYDSMEWRSASTSTRKLLTTVFNRQILATHSLTGRPSPAFHGREKPSKNQLDPAKVADIISIVTEKCGVSDKDVRNSITTKCADENKMLNQRLRREQNKENVGLNSSV